MKTVTDWTFVIAVSVTMLTMSYLALLAHGVW